MLKKILLISLIFLIFNYIFPYEKHDFGNTKLYYEYNNDLYDYVSIIVDIGYSKRILINDFIFSYENTLKKDYPIYVYHIYPDYTVLEFYLQRGEAEEFLITFNSFLNSSLLHTNKQYPIDYNVKNLVSRNMAYFYNKENGKIIKENIGKCIFGIITSLDEDKIINIVKKIDVQNTVEYNVPNKLLYGKYYSNRSIFIKDIKGIKDYNLPYFILFKYLLNQKNIYSDIYSMNNGIFFITEIMPKLKFTNREFNKSVKLWHIEYASSKRSLLYLFNNFHFFIFSNNVNYLSGIDKKISKIKLIDFQNFVNNYTVDFSFENNLEKLEFNNFKKEKLKNGIEFIYFPSKSENTEISILIKNYLNIESYYSKPFAGELLFQYINDKLNKWNILELSPLSNYKILYTSINNSIFIDEYKFFVNTIKNLSTKNINNKQNIDSIFNIIKIYTPIQDRIGKNLYSERFTNDKGALYLTSGEYNVLLKKYFSNENLIIVVKSSLLYDNIKQIINNNSFNKSQIEIPYKDIKIENSITKTFALINNFDNINLLQNIIFSIFNYPNQNIINREFVYTDFSYSLNKFNYNKNVFPFNIMYMNVETNLMALSQYIFDDPIYLLNIIK